MENIKIFTKLISMELQLLEIATCILHRAYQTFLTIFISASTT